MTKFSVKYKSFGTIERVRMMAYLVSASIGAMILINCDSLDLTKIIDGFYLKKSEGQQALVHWFSDDTYFSVVGPNVTGICLKKEYIIAEQAPTKANRGETAERVYYIVPLKADLVVPDTVVKGPYSISELTQAFKQFGIEGEIKFKEY